MKFEDFKNYFQSIKHFDIYVGFSGGADSRTIVELCSFYQKLFNLNLTLVNFEHGIRGEESILDSVFCKKVAEIKNIKFISESLNIDKTTKNIECVAREKRLNYYKQLAEKNPNHIILLGHHLDDKIENFFLRLARGSNLSGLCGFKQNTYIGNIRISRPLMSYSKTEILEFLNDQHIEYKTDSTNLDSEYGRNYLRNELLPNWFNTFSFIKGGVKKAIQNLEEDSEFIDSYVDKKFNEILKNHKLNIPTNISFFINLHNAIRIRVLKKYIQLYIREFEMTAGLISSFNKMILSYNNSDHKTLKLNNEYFLSIEGYKLFVRKFQ